MKTLLLLISMIFVAVQLGLADGMPKIGEPAPEFALQDDQGVEHSLAKYLNKIVAVYFYPKAGTPGCTKEACSIRDGFEMLTEMGVVVLGISYDHAKALKKFRSEHNLQFPLLSDATKEVSAKYDVKGLIGPKRVTFLIGPDGKIIHIFTDVDTAHHAEQIIDVVEKLKK